MACSSAAASLDSLFEQPVVALELIRQKVQPAISLSSSSPSRRPFLSLLRTNKPPVIIVIEPVLCALRQMNAGIEAFTLFWLHSYVATMAEGL